MEAGDTLLQLALNRQCEREGESRQEAARAARLLAGFTQTERLRLRFLRWLHLRGRLSDETEPAEWAGW